MLSYRLDYGTFLCDHGRKGTSLKRIIQLWLLPVPFFSSFLEKNVKNIFKNLHGL